MISATYLFEVEEVVEHEGVLLDLEGTEVLRGLQGGQRIVVLDAT